MHAKHENARGAIEIMNFQPVDKIVISVNWFGLLPPLTCELSRAFTPTRFGLSPPRPSLKSNDSKGFKNRNARAFFNFKSFYLTGWGKQQ